MKKLASFIVVILYFSSISLYSDKAPERNIKFMTAPNGVVSEEITSYNGTKNVEALKLYNSALDAFRSNQLDEAIELYKQAIEEDPRFVEAYDNLGRVFRSKNMSDSAIYYYNKSIELFPKGVFANQNKAIVYFYDEKYDEALEIYNHMTQILPDSPEGYYGIAQVSMLTARLKEAIVAIDKAIELYIKNDSPLLSDGYITKALIYAKMEDMPNTKKNLLLAKENGAELNDNMEQLIASKEQNSESNETANVLSAINWVLDNPMDEQSNKKREEVLGSLLMWTFKTDKVTIYISDELTPIDSCKICLQIFSIGWAKYVLENGDKEDLIGAATYAIRTLNNYYITNREYFEKNEMLEKFIELELEGKLKGRVTEVIEAIDKKKTQKIIVD